MISNSYYFMLKDFRDKKRNYKAMDLDEKIEFMKLDLKLNGINIKEQRFHTANEKKAAKKKNCYEKS
ncbi:hypothetical protein AK964_01575 [Clostridium butyricum]|nr:hypothetical protein AK964_01575 [Clostridium butyricum]